MLFFAFFKNLFSFFFFEYTFSPQKNSPPPSEISDLLEGKSTFFFFDSLNLLSSISEIFLPTY